MLLLLHLEGLGILLVLVLATSFFFSVQDHKFLSELLVLHTELFSDLNEASEAIDVIRVLLVNVLVDLEGLIEQIHTAVAGCNHKGPLVLLGLDLLGTLKVNNSFLKHIVFSVMHTQARDHINFGRVVAVRLLVKVDGLELILLLLVKVTHLGKNLRVRGHFGDQDIVPFKGLAAHTNQLVDMGDLVDNLVTVGDDSVQLLESLKRFVVVAKSLVNETEVVNGFDTVSFNTDSFQEEFLRAIVILVYEQTVTLVDKSFRVVSVVLNGKVSEGLSRLEVVLKEVKERDVVGGECHHNLVLLFECLE